MDKDDLLLIEIALRDMKNMEVVMAMDRLFCLPKRTEQLPEIMQDLEIVKIFMARKLPDSLRKTATAMFVEHGNKIAECLKA
jgi:hypothetical protein